MKNLEPLFDHLIQDHNLILVESEISEIARIIQFQCKEIIPEGGIHHCEFCCGPHEKT